MHNDEKWQVFAPNGEPIAGDWWSAALDNPEVAGSDAIVGVTVVFVYRINADGELELLWQRRSDKVSRYPGDYDASAGGHINLGETLTEAAVREMHEEIGVVVRADDLQFVTVRGLNKNRFAWIYAVDWTGRMGEFEFDDGEVSEVRWVPWRETEDFAQKYAKAPLKKDMLTFKMLGEWFRQQGIIENGDL
ncbi:NUDIX domain-containing protein [Candidatus Saccharibacteria bacterium]|nr:NUDIX domain-containing protein [Candidatus Saccharibacteria bacterium]